MAGNTDHWAKMKHKVGRLEILTVNWYYFSVFISKRSNRAFERLSGMVSMRGFPLPSLISTEAVWEIMKGNCRETCKENGTM